MTSQVHDLIIIGSGPAGMTASIYASRYKIGHLIFDATPGGQGMSIGPKEVENYPGFESITGLELMKRFIQQVKSYGVEIQNQKIEGLAAKDGMFEARTESESFLAKSLILAMGTSHRKLNVVGEEKLIGRGVSYCTTCDAPFFKGKVVAVIGGGDAAIYGALHLSAFAQRVYLIHRRDQYRAEPLWLERLRSKDNVTEVPSTQVKEIKGEQKVESVLLDKPFEGQSELKVDGVFIEVGQIPSSTLASGLGVEVDEQGFITVTPNMETNVPGVMAAGDLAVVKGERGLRQFVTATADGARAAASVYQFLNHREPGVAWGDDQSK